MVSKLVCLVIALSFVSVPAFAQAPPSASEQALKRSMLDLLNRVDDLERELRQIRGDLEVVNHELSGIKRRQRELYLDVDRRLGVIERGGVANQGSATTDSGPMVVDQPATAEPKSEVAANKPPAPPSREEKDSYRTAFNLLKEGRYEQSIKAFTRFMVDYPQSTYADNAQYWLGEANYVSRKYKAAVSEFSKVISDYPQSTKAPDAMVKLGFTYYELKEWDKARDMLNKVLTDYPDSSAAKLAESRLKRLKSEGN
jgi:tol-pal system protein YbgF